MQIILPCDDTDMRTRCTQQQPIRVATHEYLRDDIEQNLAMTLLMEIEYHIKLEQLKFEISEIQTFKISRVFKMLDIERRGFVDSGSIKRFLTRMGHQVLP
jgi:hypothetical protein